MILPSRCWHAANTNAKHTGVHYQQQDILWPKKKEKKRKKDFNCWIYLKCCLGVRCCHTALSEEELKPPSLLKSSDFDEKESSNLTLLNTKLLKFVCVTLRYEHNY